MNRIAPFALFAALATACEAEEVLCPDGWQGNDTGHCEPPERAYDEFPGTSGVFGYVKERGCTAHCDDIVEELVSQRVIVLDQRCGEGDESGAFDDPTTLPECDEHVIDEVESDDEGRFEIVLPPGEYSIVTRDNAFERWIFRDITLAEGFPQFVEFYFDDVPI
jgi:hypothetical protein